MKSIYTNYHFKLPISLIILFFVIETLNGQGLYDYRQIFGNNYDKAESYINLEKWISDSLIKQNIPPDFACAIIFPELIRYSTIQDQIEILSLEVLYIQFGKNYSNFSIGRFQMKPSFLEQIEKDYNILFSEKEKNEMGIHPFKTDDSPSIRKQRLICLESEFWQVKILSLFIKVMDKKYQEIKWPTMNEKLRFYATAYNSGYTKNKATIEKSGKEAYFHTGIIAPSQCYIYADIAGQYFNERLKGNTGRK